MVGWRRWRKRRRRRRRRELVAVVVLRRSNSEEKVERKEACKMQDNKGRGEEEEKKKEEMQFCWEKVGKDGKWNDTSGWEWLAGERENSTHCHLEPFLTSPAPLWPRGVWRSNKTTPDTSSEQGIIKAATASWPSNRERGGGGRRTYVTAWNSILELRNGEWKQGLGGKLAVVERREKEREMEGERSMEKTRRWMQQQPPSLSVNSVCERVGGHNTLTLATSSTGSLAAPGSAVWSVCGQDRESPVNNNNTMTTKWLIWYCNSCLSLSRGFSLLRMELQHVDICGYSFWKEIELILLPPSLWKTAFQAGNTKSYERD